MAGTVGEAISRIQSLYSKGAPSDDTRLSQRHIYDKLLTVRSRLFIQRMRKGRGYAEWDEQPLHCVEMVNQKSIPCGGTYTCTLMKSKYPIPKAISTGENEGITVTSFDGKTIFSRTSFESYKYIGDNKYTAKKHYYFIHDDYLYLVNSRMKFAHLHGHWRDPVEVYRLHMEYQKKPTCFSNRTVSLYMPLEDFESMIEMSVAELIEVFVNMREDITNNSRDSLLQETK